ncbi:MAG: DUF748 domain-containing protein, partial [Chitinophagaceae bacterium]
MLQSETNLGSNRHRDTSWFRTRKFKILASVIIFLIILRLILPYVVLHYANKTLASMKGYYGHINDIDISLYRGAYQIDSIYLNKTANKTEVGDVKKDTSDFRKLLKDFMPLKVNRFEIFNGNIQYIDQQSTPKVDVAIRQLHVLAKNLNNSYDSSTLLPASVEAQAKAYEGSLTLNMRLDALATNATFDLNAEVKNTNLVLLNDFLQAYADFDVNKGRFGLYTELAAKNGNFKGYVKPIIKDLDVVGREDRKDSFFRKIWEGIVGAAGTVFRNQKKDQIATKVPLEGNFKSPDTD